MKKLLLAGVAALCPVAAMAEGTLSWGAELRYEHQGDDDTLFFEPYAEYELENGFYAGIWLGNLGPADDPLDLEADLTVGYRGAVGKVDYDVYYTRYFYNGVGDCCGEFIAEFDYGWGDILALGTDVGYYDESGAEYGYITQELTLTHTDVFQPYISATWNSNDNNPDEAEVGFAYLFGDKHELSGLYLADVESHTEWEIGVETTLSDVLKVDVRYHDYNDADNMMAVAVKFDN